MPQPNPETGRGTALPRTLVHVPSPAGLGPHRTAHAPGRGTQRDQHRLVVLGELRGTPLVREVQVAEYLIAYPDRDAEEAAGGPRRSCRARVDGRSRLSPIATTARSSPCSWSLAPSTACSRPLFGVFDADDDLVAGSRSEATARTRSRDALSARAASPRSAFAAISSDILTAYRRSGFQVTLVPAGRGV